LSLISEMTNQITDQHYCDNLRKNKCSTGATSKWLKWQLRIRKTWICFKIWYLQLPCLTFSVKGLVRR